MYIYICKHILVKICAFINACIPARGFGTPVARLLPSSPPSHCHAHSPLANTNPSGSTYVVPRAAHLPDRQRIHQRRPAPLQHAITQHICTQAAYTSARVHKSTATWSACSRSYLHGRVRCRCHCAPRLFVSVSTCKYRDGFARSHPPLRKQEHTVAIMKH